MRDALAIAILRALKGALEHAHDHIIYLRSRGIDGPSLQHARNKWEQARAGLDEFIDWWFKMKGV